ncbi:hypothetical protein B0O99DRAFT_744636 [Bisporella sp. PMI_857]|nr:hypothetical protein B0O99DRAFT_744636 [Bisporella sp. PMI_857]
MANSYSSNDDKFTLVGEDEIHAPPYECHTPRSAVSSAGASKYVMADEERYPTVIDTQPGLHPYLPADARSEETILPLDRSLVNLQKLSMAPPTAPVRKHFGIPRPIFLRLLAGFLAFVIISTIIGVVVGLKLKSKPRTRLPAITSSGVFVGDGKNGTNWNMQLYYMNSTTGEVTFRLHTGGATWGAEQTMNLSIIPEVDASMTATSMAGSDGNVYLNLFYIKGTAIILANVSCTDTVCETVFNDAITKGVTFPLSRDSALDAVYLGSSDGFRVFYHNSDHYITQLGSFGDGLWDRGQTISGKALAGSSISAVAVGTEGDINVVYVDAKSKMLYNVQWDGRWGNPAPLTNVTIPNWDPLAAMTLAWQPASDTLRAYFTDTHKFIQEFSGRNASTADFAAIARGDVAQNSTSGITTPGWTQSPIHDLTWLPSDALGAEIASVAWLDQVRFYRLIEGKLAESALAQGVWSAKFI